MKINNLYKTYTHNIRQRLQYRINNTKSKIKTLKDVFVYKRNDGLEKIEGFYEGEYGTQCIGSKPLPNFFESIKRKNLNLKKIIESGESTNITGGAYAFLKTASDRPISTSEVHDCSVLYLYNNNNNTHFLYHIYRSNTFKDIDYIIKTFMQEGFSKAIIVPGDKTWIGRHETYLPEVFEAVKYNNPNAKINVYHCSSFLPEITFWQGRAYEIPNKTKDFKGQATFKIKDYRTWTTLHDVGCCKTVEALNTTEEEFKRKKISKLILKVLNKLIRERKSAIIEIQSCKNADELDKIAQKYDYDEDFTWMPDAMGGCRDFYDVIKKQSFKIAEGTKNV